MSKYIRTKDNKIYELSSDTDFEKTKETYVWCFDKRFGFHFQVDTKNIIKQADTIEELIDDFVVIVDGKHYIRVPVGNPNFPTYGSIWVDDNLIKVAKMNDKGELELL